MTKSDFINAIQRRLDGIPAEEIQKSVDYFSEMIDDRIEDGMSEEEAVAEIGSVDDAIREILNEIPLSTVIKAKTKSGRKLKTWEIVLLCIGSPIWAPLLLCFIVLIAVLYIVIWAVVISLFATDLALFLSGIASVIIGFSGLFQSPPALPLAVIGCGLVLTGGSIMLFIPLLKLAKATAKLAKIIVLWIKSGFIRREKDA